MVEIPAQTLTARMSAAAFDAYALQPERRERRLELIAGEVHEVVTNPVSSIVTARLITFLGVYLLDHDIGELTGPDGGYAFGEERYIPDIAFMRHEKRRAVNAVEGYVAAAPDLVVEVLSPGNTHDELRMKLATYLAFGTVVWIVDPARRRVEVATPGRAPRELRDGDTLSGGEVLPGFALAVAEIWPASLQVAPGATP